VTDAQPTGDSFRTDLAGDLSGTANILDSKGVTQNNVENNPNIAPYINPNIAITNTTQEQIAQILFHVSNQNSLLNSLAVKLETHISRVEDRFRDLERTTSKLEIALNGLVDRFRGIEKSHVELEHASERRGVQTTALENQLNEVKRTLIEVTARQDALKTEVMSLRTDIPKVQTKENEKGIPQWGILLLGVVIALFVVFMIFLGVRLMGGA